MNQGELIERLDIVAFGEEFRINARESTDLEFKAELSLAVFKKSLKTIAAFANKGGGYIVFGVRDRPKTLIGIGDAWLDEGIQSEYLVKNLVPVPVTHFFTARTHNKLIAVLHVEAASRPPVISICDLQSHPENENILRQGVVYTRRRGQTSSISGEEFSQIMNARDQQTREEIFSFLARGKQVGFDKVVVAKAGVAKEGETGMTFYLPAAAAKDLNVIDRARLVQEGGAPAYEIQGTVHLTIPNADDPRLPLKASDSCTSMLDEIRRNFGDDFPWNFSHLKRAAKHLGLWPTDDGDGHHTGREKLTGTTVYYHPGREAILNFSKQNPDEFVEVVGSQETRLKWGRQKNP